MPEDDAKTWPNYRIDPRLKERLEKLLSRAGDRSSITKIINDLLGESLAQIESHEQSPPAMITIHRLRQATGRTPIMPEDLATRVLKLEESQVDIRNLVQRLHGAAETHEKVSAGATKKKAARKRAA